MKKQPVNRLYCRGPKLIVDNFAGGGGASTGIEMALGRSPDVAINHDPEALAMHMVNHPHTRHYATDVFDIDPRVVCRNQPVGLAWFSPDCTHHSKARGGKPIREAGKKSRSLAWIVTKWARHVRPEVILLENVEEFRQWGPLVDGRPCPARKGKTFRLWVRSLQRLGYQVEWRELRACDYGAPTIRKRLFVVARCDGQPIVWPEPTHGKPGSAEVLAGQRLPWRTAAEIIDWSLPCPSIFLTPEEAKQAGCRRPLKPNTLDRIARGLQRYVIDNPQPFIVCCNHGGDEFRGQSIHEPAATVTASRDAVGLVTPYVTAAQQGGSNRPADLPLHTVTASRKDQNAVVAPILSSYYGAKSDGDSRCQSPGEPLPTQSTENRFGLIAPHLQRQFGESVGSASAAPVPTVMPGSGGKSALVSAFIAQHNAGANNANISGRSAEAPLSTITTRGTQQQVAAAYLSHSYTSNTCGGNGDLNTPLKTVVAGGQHHAQVLAFLQKYYGSGGQHADCRDPMHTLTAKARIGIVTVNNVDYQIVDIGMRMLTPRELFRAQGFPDSYQIDIPHQGKRLTKSSQVRMCGNSVCPPLAAALARANCPHLIANPEPRTKPRRQLELAGV
jgi:DNA (cytosine-5)-methyltransferase 1